MSKTPETIHVLSIGLESILGPLNVGLQGEHGTISISANKQGLTIRVFGKIYARGRTLVELRDSYSARIKRS